MAQSEPAEVRSGPGGPGGGSSSGRGGGSLRSRGGRGAGRARGGADAERTASTAEEDATNARVGVRGRGRHVGGNGGGRGSRPTGGGSDGRGSRANGGGGSGSGGAGARVQGECKVSAESNIQKVSGFIAAGVRGNQPATVLAISDLAVNKAIKALALARNFLASENLDLVAQPRFPEYDKAQGTAHMQLDLQAKQTRVKLDELAAGQMAVSQHSVPTAVAGAIASSAREGKHITKVSGMGPQAVLRTVKAIFLARRYLRADNLDLSFVPEFSDADGLTVINFYVFAHVPAADAAQLGGSRATLQADAAAGSSTPEPKA